MDDPSMVSKLASNDIRNKYILLAIDLARTTIKQNKRDHTQPTIDDAKQSLAQFCRFNNLDEPIWPDDLPWAHHTWPPLMPTKKSDWSPSSPLDSKEEIEGSGRDIQIPQLKMLKVAEVQSIVNEMENLALDAHYTNMRTMQIERKLFDILAQLPEDHILFARDMILHIDDLTKIARRKATKYAKSMDNALGTLKCALQLIEKHEQDKDAYAFALAFRAINQYAGKIIFT